MHRLRISFIFFLFQAPSFFRPIKMPINPSLTRRNTCTLERNRNATLFQWKIHGVLFKVMDGDNKPSSFQEMLMNSTKQGLK